jgi:ribonuclease D
MQESFPPPLWVASATAMQSMLTDLLSQTRVSVDTESNSLHAYREQVCLIQFSTPTRDYLVDPFAFDELDALAPLFAHRNIEKIFHAAEYDLICLRRDYGFRFSNLFDTMQAARILGYQKVGLDGLLAEKFNLQMNKRFQKADWGERPLSRDQVEYARLDTRYLIQLRDQLQAELEAKGLWTLASEDFRRACHPNGDSGEPTEPWERFAGRRDLTPRQMTILRELCDARETIAARLDRPPFKVLSDERLLAIARMVPETREALEQAGLSRHQVNRWGVELLTATARGTQAPLVKRRPVQRPDDAMLNRLDKLKQWRKKVAAELGVESDIVLPRPFLMVLAERGGREINSILESSPWRLRQYGLQIKEVLGDCHET